MGKIIVSAALTTFLLFSCNSSNNNRGSDQNSNDSTKKASVSGGYASNAGKKGFRLTNNNLRCLYMSKQVYGSIHKPGNGNKLVVNFLFPEVPLDGSPTLAVWSWSPNENGNQSHRPNSHYPDENPDTVLIYAIKSKIVAPSKNYLGNLETLDNLDQEIRRHPECSDKCVILFVPTADQTLTYNLYLISDSNDVKSTLPGFFDSKNNIIASTPIGHLNPSPPY